MHTGIRRFDVNFCVWRLIPDHLVFPNNNIEVIFFIKDYKRIIYFTWAQACDFKYLSVEGGGGGGMDFK